MGDATCGPVRFSFNSKLRVEFRGATPARGRSSGSAPAGRTANLFLRLLRRLRETFPRAWKLHVVLDNYGIHSSTLVQRALTEEFGGRIVWHFLPPYSPKHNRIERLWRELHANVTRNHRCRTLPELLHNVAVFLRRASPYPGTKASLIRTPKRRAA